MASSRRSSVSASRHLEGTPELTCMTLGLGISLLNTRQKRNMRNRPQKMSIFCRNAGRVPQIVSATAHPSVTEMVQRNQRLMRMLRMLRMSRVTGPRHSGAIIAAASAGQATLLSRGTGTGSRVASGSMRAGRRPGTTPRGCRKACNEWR